MVRRVLSTTMSNRRLLLLFLIISVQSAFAQMGKLFDASQQLSSNFVNQVYLDNDGFLWVVTRNGLTAMTDTNSIYTRKIRSSLTLWRATMLTV